MEFLISVTDTFWSRKFCLVSLAHWFIHFYVCLLLANIFLVFRIFPCFAVCVSLVWDLLLLSVLFSCFSLWLSLEYTVSLSAVLFVVVFFVFGLFVGILFGNYIWKANYRSNVRSKMRALFLWKLYTCLCSVLGGTTCLRTSSSKPESPSHWITRACCQLHAQVFHFLASPSGWRCRPHSPASRGKKGLVLGLHLLMVRSLFLPLHTACWKKSQPADWHFLHLHGTRWGFNPEIPYYPVSSFFEEIWKIFYTVFLAVFSGSISSDRIACHYPRS